MSSSRIRSPASSPNSPARSTSTIRFCHKRSCAEHSETLVIVVHDRVACRVRHQKKLAFSTRTLLYLSDTNLLTVLKFALPEPFSFCARMHWARSAEGE